MWRGLALWRDLAPVRRGLAPSGRMALVQRGLAPCGRGCPSCERREGPVWEAGLRAEGAVPMWRGLALWRGLSPCGGGWPCWRGLAFARSTCGTLRIFYAVILGLFRLFPSARIPTAYRGTLPNARYGTIIKHLSELSETRTCRYDRAYIIRPIMEKRGRRLSTYDYGFSGNV
jgi:hypothetical protein